MTIAQQMRLQGFKASLAVRGRSVVTDTGTPLTVTITDAPELPDPDKPAQAKSPVWVILTTYAGAIKSPRTVNTFQEPETKREYRVVRYNESVGNDGVSWSWLCEALRNV